MKMILINMICGYNFNICCTVTLALIFLLIYNHIIRHILLLYVVLLYYRYIL